MRRGTLLGALPKNALRAGPPKQPPPYAQAPDARAFCVVVISPSKSAKFCCCTVPSKCCKMLSWAS
eukprot:200301-Alexandrium_andersonii.AAC.1